MSKKKYKFQSTIENNSNSLTEKNQVLKRHYPVHISYLQKYTFMDDDDADAYDIDKLYLVPVCRSYIAIT